MQKALTQMNVQLANAIGEIGGWTGQAHRGHPGGKSCDFSFARFFCFDRDLDVDFCDVDFCVLAIALFLRGEWTRRGPVANGLKVSPTGSSRRLDTAGPSPNR